MTALAVAGWLCSAALAVVLTRRRRHALARAGHLARVAHELRGPLHAAGMVLHSVRRQTAGDAQSLGALAALEVELGRLALAAEDLQADRPRHRPSEPSPDMTPVGCDVAALVRALAPGWEAQAAGVGRTLDVTVPEGGAYASGARLRLAQALGNLVANALEHGAGDVGVLVRVTPGATVAVEISDAGEGLPATVAALVTRPTDPLSRHGHGLAIAATIAKDAGGRLAAAPTARGARLVLSLPAAPGARTHRHARQITSSRRRAS
jgi:signal transduction histidine kinase